MSPVQGVHVQKSHETDAVCQRSLSHPLRSHMSCHLKRSFVKILCYFACMYLGTKYIPVSCLYLYRHLGMAVSRHPHAWHTAQGCQSWNSCHLWKDIKYTLMHQLKSYHHVYLPTSDGLVSSCQLNLVDQGEVCLGQRSPDHQNVSAKCRQGGRHYFWHG